MSALIKVLAATAPIVLILAGGDFAQSVFAQTTAPSVPLHFWISNQSVGTSTKEVQMTVSVDGRVIFDRLMAVLTQHNIAALDQEVPSGARRIDVKVGTPYALSIDKVVEIAGERWIFVRFRYDPQSVAAAERSPSIVVDVFKEMPGIQ